MRRRTSEGWFRLIVFQFAALLGTPLFWALAALALPLQPRRQALSDVMARTWARLLLLAAGCRVRLEGAEHVDPASVRLVVANHASYLDPVILMAWWPARVRFVIKQELGRVPFVGWHVRLTGHFLLDRADPRAGRELLQRAVERVRRLGASPVVFAEGTRSPDGRLRELKAGSFQIAVAGGLLVQPVAILGSAELMPKGTLGPIRGGDVRLRAGAPLRAEDQGEATDSGARRALAVRTRQTLLALGVPPGPPDA